jgi:hypothetical protein
MSNFEALSAWIGSRLNPNGKCRLEAAGGNLSPLSRPVTV